MLIRRGSQFNAITENKMIFSICRNFSEYFPPPVRFEHCSPPLVVFKTSSFYLNGRDVPAFGVTVFESNPEKQVVVTNVWKVSAHNITICRLDGRLVSAYRMLNTSSVPDLKSGFRRLLGDRLIFAFDGKGESSDILPEGLVGEDGQCRRMDLALSLAGLSDG